MLLNSSWLLVLGAIGVVAQDSTTSSTDSSSSASSTVSLQTATDLGTATQLSFSTLTTDIPASLFSVSGYHYSSYTAQITLDTSTDASAGNASATSTSQSASSDSQITRTSTSQTLLVVSGASTTSSNGTVSTSSTSTAVAPTNTIPCNNYPEFCNRKYSNITEVCAHNAAFHVKNNIASNQDYGIIQQLNDGVRMLEGETHWVNNTIYSCHTSCDLLNAGTWQSELETIVSWVENHPYDVVSILISNSDFQDGVTVENYVAPIQNSGIAQYLYEPEYIPQYRDQWPTLGQMILTGKRVVMFMDYNANQTAVPYVLDQFSHMWQTPFSPTNQSFPCTQGQGPELNETESRDLYMYIANHNLNLAIDVSALTGTSDDVILVPDTARMNITNGDANQFSQLGAMTSNCTSDWGRPPNFLVVDYYNIGSPSAGSVFNVAAQANGVTYTRSCCGQDTSSSIAPTTFTSHLEIVIAALMFSVLLAW